MARFPTRRAPRSAFSVSPFGRLDERLSQLMEDVYDESEEMVWLPAVDVVDSEDEITLTAEMPGLDRGDIQIDVENDILRIHGEKREEKETEEGEDGRIRVSERRYGAFSRSFSLPASVDAEDISAEMRNGVLTVRLPKTEVARGRRIEIEGD